MTNSNEKALSNNEKALNKEDKAFVPPEQPPSFHHDYTDVIPTIFPSPVVNSDPIVENISAVTSTHISSPDTVFSDHIAGIESLKVDTFVPDKKKKKKMKNHNLEEEITQRPKKINHPGESSGVNNHSGTVTQPTSPSAPTKSSGMFTHNTTSTPHTSSTQQSLGQAYTLADSYDKSEDIFLPAQKLAPTKPFKAAELEKSDNSSITPPSPLTASVSVKYIGIKSVAKVSAAFGGALGVIWIAVITVIYFTLALLGVWDKLNSTISGAVAHNSDSLIAWKYVIIITILTGILIALATIGISIFAAVLFNLCAETFGGIDIELYDKPWTDSADKKSSTSTPTTSNSGT